jgi:hypothetical protein
MPETLETTEKRYGVNPDEVTIIVNGQSRSLTWLLANLPAAKIVRVYNCSSLSTMPDLPAATEVRVSNCPSLTTIGDLPAATEVVVSNCSSLSTIGDLPAATKVVVYDCPSLPRRSHSAKCC